MTEEIQRYNFLSFDWTYDNSITHIPIKYINKMLLGEEIRYRDNLYRIAVRKNKQ